MHPLVPTPQKRLPMGHVPHHPVGLTHHQCVTGIRPVYKKGCHIAPDVLYLPQWSSSKTCSPSLVRGNLTKEEPLPLPSRREQARSSAGTRPEKGKRFSKCSGLFFLITNRTNVRIAQRILIREIRLFVAFVIQEAAHVHHRGPACPGRKAGDPDITRKESRPCE